jgi:hypothetical protein
MEGGREGWKNDWNGKWHIQMETYEMERGRGGGILLETGFSFQTMNVWNWVEEEWLEDK